VVGQKIIINDPIPEGMWFPPPGESMTKKQKMQKIIDLLKFALSTDDDEIIRATVEAVIENLEDYA
jgi:hypothetical protein